MIPPPVGAAIRPNDRGPGDVVNLVMRPDDPNAGLVKAYDDVAEPYADAFFGKPSRKPFDCDLSGQFADTKRMPTAG